MRSTEQMSSEEIARVANGLSENTVGRLIKMSHAMASNATAMNLIKEMCPPGISPNGFATAILIGMAVADEFQETHGIVRPSSLLIS